MKIFTYLYKINKMKKRLIFLALVLFILIVPDIVSSAGTPIIIASVTSPTIVYTNTDFKLNLTITDPDTDTLTGYVQFYVNGTPSGPAQSRSMNNNTNTLIGTLSHSSFGTGAKLIAEYWAGDGTDNTTKENTTEKVSTEEPKEVIREKPTFPVEFGLKKVNLNITWTWVVIVVIGILTAFFVQKKWNLLEINISMESESIIAITAKMEKAEKFIKEGDINSAKKIYKKIIKAYDWLPVKERRWTYKEIQSLYNKIKTMGG